MALMRGAVFNLVTGNVPVATNVETVVATSDPMAIPSGSVQIAVLGWAQLTTGAGTTFVTARIRRGTTVGGVLVGEGNPETRKVPIGSTEPFSILVGEIINLGGTVQYVLTLQQTAASGNGTAVQSSIAAFALA